MAKYVKFLASAGYFPETVVTNDELSQIMETNDEWIQAHTGIKERRYAIDENTSDLSTKVALKLLKQSNLQAEAIDLIILSTISPDAITPSTAAIVQSNIGAKNAFAFDISAACSGFVYALSIAEKYVRSGQYQNVMVISAEVNSKMMDFTDRTSAVFFGDAAGGAILSASDNPNDEMYVAEKLATKGDADVIHSGRIAPLSAVKADNYPQMDAFYQDGRAVYEFVTSTVLAHIQQFLAEQKLTADDFDLIVLHQANLRLIEYIAQELKQPLDKFAINVPTIGNTSSAGLPTALAERLSDGQTYGKVLLTGFGAGLAYGSVILNLQNFSQK
ncbi:beta-ketoacyl-ACP synthase III [Ligilactobacillus ceti]|uniref:Beta-ketoacyl-[acyl-carrier-protein] synthase III n=1 Tax=Ligilactobacillus ceti DSM 22408 TaxID=1122146 RepID=A0A0R2KIQ3_9LACO|nr:beta-ketoacyl-ACP synthase III [Ligilactobacillus ceti]KRN89051.1 3-oxoacyl-(acyl carrier protein) synthase III [Ligilactobacillus ceti DSM 22408]